jgi:hypothetical protein
MPAAADISGKAADDLFEHTVGITRRRRNRANAMKLDREEAGVTAGARVEIAGEEAKVRHDAEEKRGMPYRGRRDWQLKADVIAGGHEDDHKWQSFCLQAKLHAHRCIAERLPRTAYCHFQ